MSKEMSGRDQTVIEDGNSSDHHEENYRNYPEGGMKAWSVVLGSWCAMMPAMGLLNTIGVLHAWTSTHQLKDYSPFSIGWIFGCYSFFLYLAGAQSGEFKERYSFEGFY